MTGAGLDGVIYDIVTDGIDIYTANVVSSVYGTVIESWVQKWDGASWSVVGHHFDASTKFNGMITDLAIVDGALYVGGDIYEGYDLWKLTGSLWYPISDKVCLALESYNGDLVVGGDFRDLGSLRACYIAGYNGSMYYPLAEHPCYGFGGAVYYIALDGSDMYVGGSFTIAGDKASGAFGKWELQDVVPVLVQSFTAKPGAGHVELSRSITGDPEVVGFWINRKNVRTERQNVLNETMLPPATSMFVDNGVLPGETYRYWLDVVQPGGAVQSMPRDATVAPYILSLRQNVPNPLNPSTLITFTTVELQPVKLGVFDIAGRLVAMLVNEIRPPGIYQAEWDGTDNAGERVATGVYFVRLRAGTQTLTRKISLVK